MALVEEDLGREIPLAIARMMVVFPRRPGGQSQFSPYVNFLEEGKSRPDIGELQAWILGHPGEDLSVSALADRMAMSPRNFARLFNSETGGTPAQFAERARADAARRKLEQTVLPVETIAEECGRCATRRGATRRRDLALRARVHECNGEAGDSLSPGRQ
jgi:transcriptional regulator GlxA family with amidase domain